MLSGVNPADAATRAKSRRGSLIDSTRMRQLIQQTPEQLTATVADSGYRAEMDLYAGRFTGAELVEVALSHNLGREINSVLGFCGGNLGDQVRVFAARFGYANAKIVLRAVFNEVDLDKVAHNLLPVENEDNGIWLDIIKNNSTLHEAAGNMREKQYRGAFKSLLEESTLSDYEDALDRHYYSNALKAVSGKGAALGVLRSFLKSEIDHRNLLNLIQGAAIGMTSEDRLSRLIIGGSLIPKSQFIAASNADLDGIVDLMRRSTRFDASAFEEALEKSKEMFSLDPVVLWLQSNQQAVLSRMSYLHPVSALPIIHYLSSKVQEVANLRLIVRGREAGLEPGLLEAHIL